MADPPTEFVALLEGATLPEGTNLYPGPTNQIGVPAIVLRPDTTWMEQSGYCAELERYAAVCVVQSASQGGAHSDGIAQLRAMSLAIIGALEPPWDWSQVDGPVIDESTGTAYLANRVRLLYRNGGLD